MEHVSENSPPAALLLGRKMIRHDQAREEAVIEYQAKPEFTNRHGTIQGGFLTAMLDSATALTLIANLPEGFTAVTHRLDSTFLKPAPIGRLIATATVQDRSTRDAKVTAELATEDGLIVARARSHLRILKRS
jgi:uncharacterized protein (TIGR00369 family)